MVLSIVVERAKKCLDFASTVMGFHFLLCWLCGGFPANWEWWVVMIATLSVMVIVAEFLCVHYELKPILVKHQRSQSADSHEPSEEEASLI